MALRGSGRSRAEWTSATGSANSWPDADLCQPPAEVAELTERENEILRLWLPVSPTLTSRAVW